MHQHEHEYCFSFFGFVNVLHVGAMFVVNIFKNDLVLKAVSYLHMKLALQLMFQLNKY